MELVEVDTEVLVELVDTLVVLTEVEEVEVVLREVEVDVELVDTLVLEVEVELVEVEEVELEVELVEVLEVEVEVVSIVRSLSSPMESLYTRFKTIALIFPNPMVLIALRSLSTGRDKSLSAPVSSL